LLGMSEGDSGCGRSNADAPLRCGRWPGIGECVEGLVGRAGVRLGGERRLACRARSFLRVGARGGGLQAGSEVPMWTMVAGLVLAGGLGAARAESVVVPGTEVPEDLQAGVSGEVVEPARDLLAEEIEHAWLRRRKVERAAMSTLVGVSGASAVVGAVGLGLAKTPQQRGFYGGTLGWSAVNLGIGIPGLIGALRKEPPPGSLEAWRKEDAQLRSAFLFNAGLDVGWVALGAFLWQFGLAKEERAPLVGAGQAVVIQGAFLLVFDSVLTGVTGGQSRRFWASPVVGERMGVAVGGVM
jgi:hypothetical protein